MIKVVRIMGMGKFMFLVFKATLMHLFSEKQAPMNIFCNI